MQLPLHRDLRDQSQTKASEDATYTSEDESPEGDTTSPNGAYVWTDCRCHCTLISRRHGPAARGVGGCLSEMISIGNSADPIHDWSAPIPLGITRWARLSRLTTRAEATVGTDCRCPSTFVPETTALLWRREVPTFKPVGVSYRVVIALLPTGGLPWTYCRRHFDVCGSNVLVRRTQTTICS